MDYVSLREKVVEQGLLDRQYGYYALKVITTLGLLALSIFFISRASNIGFVLLAAAFLAFVYVQFGFIMHDAVHQQIFNGKAKNDFAGVVVGSLVLHTSSSSWFFTHNQHHSAPNHSESDPDIDMPILAFSEEQALAKRGLPRFIVRYQAFVWFLMMALVPGFSIPLGTGKLLLTRVIKPGRSAYLVEAILLVVGYAAYFGIVFHFLSLWSGILFVLVHHSLTGLYMGTTFATNHKAMPLMKEKLDFLRMQVLTTRNVKYSPLVSIWCGGLNYQIEHHLFPTMPRNNLGKSQELVKSFCKNLGVEYYETGFFKCYAEILSHFHKVSSPLRQPKRLQASILPLSQG